MTGCRLREGQVGKASARITATTRDGIAGPHRFGKSEHDSQRRAVVQTTGYSSKVDFLNSVPHFRVLFSTDVRARDDRSKIQQAS